MRAENFSVAGSLRSAKTRSAQVHVLPAPLSPGQLLCDVSALADTPLLLALHCKLLKALQPYPPIHMYTVHTHNPSQPYLFKLSRIHRKLHACVQLGHVQLQGLGHNLPVEALYEAGTCGDLLGVEGSDQALQQPREGLAGEVLAAHDLGLGALVHHVAQTIPLLDVPLVQVCVVELTELGAIQVWLREAATQQQIQHV